MQRVQQALNGIGIPVQFGVFKNDTKAPIPDSFIVYTTMRVESEHSDDAPSEYKVYVYLNLYTKNDSETLVKQIRAAMRENGFALSSELTSWDGVTDQMLTAFTWICWEDASDADEV